MKNPLLIYPSGIKADEKRLRQVLINLLGNSIKFTDRGEVKLRVKPLKIDLEQVKLRFEIIDTGVGMTSEQVTKIFQPFEQVGDLKRRAEGTGLGLAITQKLLELMGSQLQVKSSVNQGSIFWFEAVFPAIILTPITTNEIPDKIIGYQGKKQTVLIVDDKIENRLVLQNMLEPLGFNIVLGEDGQQEIELAQKSKPDLILTDLVMPVKTGFEAIQEIRQLPEFDNIPIIAVSASLMNFNQEKSRISGFDAFLSKPIDEQELLKVLGEHLQLEWVYESLELQKSDDLHQSAPLVIPPELELAQLLDWVKAGFLFKIKQRIEQLKISNTQYTVFAQKVEKMTDSFEIKGLQQFLQDCQNQENKATQSLEIPPIEEIEFLYELARIGSMRKIQERATYLEELDQKYSLFAQQLKTLAQEFKDEEIILLVESHLKTI
jgi:CheY-like chemotaxis protein